MTKLMNLKQNLKKWHEDERGLEALQTVMIIAVAAIIMLLVKEYYTSVKGWAGGLITSITGWKTT